MNIASRKDLPPGKIKLFEVKGTSILLANVDGEFYAIAEKCTHRGCKLSKGALIGEIVKCPCHGSGFNVKTGEVVNGPAKKSPQKYELKIEQDQIRVNL